MHINLTYARTLLLPLATWLGAFYYGAGKAARRSKPCVFGKGWGLRSCPQTWPTSVGINVESPNHKNLAALVQIFIAGFGLSSPN